jgi:hypothetical protein
MKAVSELSRLLSFFPARLLSFTGLALSTGTHTFCWHFFFFVKSSGTARGWGGCGGIRSRLAVGTRTPASASAFWYLSSASLLSSLNQLYPLLTKPLTKAPCAVATKEAPQSLEAFSQESVGGRVGGWVGGWRVREVLRELLSLSCII